MTSLNTPNKFSIKDALGIAVSVLFLLLLIQRVDWNLLLSNVPNMHVGALFSCWVVHIVQTWGLGIRWRFVFAEQQNTHQANAVASYWLGNFYNNLLPGRLGDLVRAYHFSKKSGLKYQITIAGLISEKAVAVQTLLFFAAIYLAFFRISINLLNNVVAVFALIILMANAGLLYFMYNAWFVKAVLRLIPMKGAARMLYGLFLNFIAQIKHLWLSKKIIGFVVFDIALYGVGVLTTYLILMTAGLEDVFQDIAIYLGFPIFFMVIHFIPSAPSSAGVVHYGTYKILMLIAASKIHVTPELENKIIFSTIICHLVYFVPETIIGSYYMLKERHLLFGFRRSTTG